MRKKIALIEPRPDEELYAKYAGDFLKNHLATIGRAKAPDTEIESFICPPGFWKGPHTVVDYFMNALAVPTICKGVIDAEKGGADAAIIVCTDDPGLRFARQLVDIPVVGEFESTLHMAAMMGHKFGVLAWPTRPFMARSEMKIRQYGLWDKACYNPIEPVVEPGPDAERIVVTEGYADPKAFVEKYYIPAAQKLIARGAEVIIMDSTGLGLIAENAGFREVTDVGISLKPKNPTVPILEVSTISLKFAEMMVDLQRLGINPVSRIGLYQKVDALVSPKDLETIRDAFENNWQPLPFPSR